MTPKLNKLIDDTAKQIVKTTDDCLFEKSKIEKTKTALIQFTAQVVAELESPTES
jgi:hypothetical protein